MSSPAAVEVIALKETNYGKTPPLGATTKAEAVRFISESLSGTPTTTTSAEVRSDRMSGGQVVTGLESGGGIDFELSKDPVYDEFIAGALMNNWVTGVKRPAGSLVLTKDANDEQVADLTITGDTGNVDGANRALKPGDVLVLSGFTHAANNGPVQVISVTDATHVKVAVPRASVTETAAAGVWHLPDYVDIGAVTHSWTLSKAYTDVLHNQTQDEHSQRYTGSVVNTMSLEVAYGQIVTGSFGFLSNGYEQEHPSLSQKVEAAGGSITPAGTANPLNGSVDMPMVTVGGQPTDFCIESLSLSLDNGNTPQNCIGKLAPTKYTPGTVNLQIDATIYLGDPSYDKFMPAKLSMTPISIFFAALNQDGGYGFDLRAVQLSFPDPSVSGGDTPVMIEASGTAKVGPGGSSALRVWRWDAAPVTPPPAVWAAPPVPTAKATFDTATNKVTIPEGLPAAWLSSVSALYPANHPEPKDRFHVAVVPVGAAAGVSPGILDKEFSGSDTYPAEHTGLDASANVTINTPYELQLYVMDPAGAYQKWYTVGPFQWTVAP